MKIKEALKDKEYCEEKETHWQIRLNESYEKLHQARVDFGNRIKDLFTLDVSVQANENYLLIKRDGTPIVEHYANHKTYQGISQEKYNEIIALYEDEVGEPTEDYHNSHCLGDGSAIFTGPFQIGGLK